MSQPIVHVLGMGSIGTLLACELLKHTKVSIVPLFRSAEKVTDFVKKNKSTIGLRKLYLKDAPLNKYVLKECYSPELFQPADGSIRNLIVTTKTYQTIDALKPYLPFINSETNIILVQNGLGVLEMVRGQFSDTATRPQLFQGVISDGVYPDSGYTYNHAGSVGMKISRLFWNESEMIQTIQSVEQDRIENPLVNLLTTPVFAENFKLQHVTYQELLLAQLYKFLLNCCMNPVTAIVDTINGDMQNHCQPTFRLILDEAIQILKKTYTPLFNYSNSADSEAYPFLDISQITDTARLADQINQIGCVTCAKNTTSMRQDTKNFRKTEIDYINGYLLKQANQMQLSPQETKINRLIVELVKLRSCINQSI